MRDTSGKCQSSRVAGTMWLSGGCLWPLPSNSSGLPTNPSTQVLLSHHSLPPPTATRIPLMPPHHLILSGLCSSASLHGLPPSCSLIGLPQACLAAEGAPEEPEQGAPQSPPQSSGPSAILRAGKTRAGHRWWLLAGTGLVAISRTSLSGIP